MKSTTITKFAASAALGLTAIGAAQAATITWGTPTTISGDSDVSTTGALVSAFTFGTGNTTTVNGVTFVPFPGGTPDTSTFTSTYAGFSTGSGQIATLSPSYQALLTGGAYTDGSASTLTLNGLTPGSSYQVESWVNDSRSCCGAPRTETLGDGTGGAQSGSLAYSNNPAVDGGVGQFVIGTFVADGTGSQAISYNPFNYAPSSQVNGFELRASAIPEPSTWVAAGGLLLLAAGDFRRRLKA